MTKSDAQKALRALQRASGELAFAADLVRPDPSDPAALSYRKAIARIIMTIFDEVSVPIYRTYPELIPKRERDIVEAALRRRMRDHGGDD